jgi:preprotein translocase subunit SecD
MILFVASEWHRRRSTMFQPTRRFEATLWLAIAIVGSFFVGTTPGEEKEKPKAPRLEFRILANEVDEPKALEAAKNVFLSAKKDEKVKKELERLAREGKPPRPLALATGKTPGYTWVEIGPVMLKYLELDDETATDDKRTQDRKVAKSARDKGEALTLKTQEGCLLFSRICLDTGLSKEARDRKKFDYFLLTRDPQKGKTLTGEYLIGAKFTERPPNELELEFKIPHRREIELEFGKEGGSLMFELTSANRPSPDDDRSEFRRCMAIIVNGKVFSAPELRDPIKSKAIISGVFPTEEAKALADGLRLDIAAKKK